MLLPPITIPSPGDESDQPPRKIQTSGITSQESLKTAISFNQKNKVPGSAFPAVGVHPDIARKLMEIFNAKNPSQTQEKLIPAILAQQNIMVKDQTGTGKTLGLLAGVLSKKSISSAFMNTDTRNKGSLNCMIVLPTSALAAQVFEWTVALLGLSVEDTRVQCILTIEDLEKQEKRLKESSPTIIIGTPQRLLDLYDRKAYSVERLETLVLDEIDRMVDFERKYDTVKTRYYKTIHKMPAEILIPKIIHTCNEFRSALEEEAEINMNEIYLGIFHGLKEEIPTLQVIACSATLNSTIRHNLKDKRRWLEDPIILDMCGSDYVPKSLTHSCLVITDEEVRDINMSTPCSSSEFTVDGEIVAQIIAETWKSGDFSRGLVFAHSSRSISQLADQITKAGVPSKKLWVDLKADQQGIEEKSIDGEKMQLICVDEATCRGLDIPNVDLVIILGPPSCHASYLHMSGRTGRFGNPGRVVTIVESKHERKMSGVFKLMGVKPVPIVNQDPK